MKPEKGQYWRHATGKIYRIVKVEGCKIEVAKYNGMHCKYEWEDGVEYEECYPTKDQTFTRPMSRFLIRFTFAPEHNHESV